MNGTRTMKLKIEFLRQQGFEYNNKSKELIKTDKQLKSGWRAFKKAWKRGVL